MKMLKFDIAGWWVSQVFVIFFIIFPMFLIKKFLISYLKRKKGIELFGPTQWPLTNLLLESVFFINVSSYLLLSLCLPWYAITYKFEFASYLLVRKTDFEPLQEVHVA